VEQNSGPAYRWVTMPTLFSRNVPKTYSEEKTALLTNVAGKSGYLPAEN
jgi:hypothetical protein